MPSRPQTWSLHLEHMLPSLLPAFCQLQDLLGGVAALQALLRPHHESLELPDWRDERTQESRLAVQGSTLRLPPPGHKALCTNPHPATPLFTLWKGNAKLPIPASAAARARSFSLVCVAFPTAGIARLVWWVGTGQMVEQWPSQECHDSSLGARACHIQVLAEPGLRTAPASPNQAGCPAMLHSLSIPFQTPHPH